MSALVAYSTGCSSTCWAGDLMAGTITSPCRFEKQKNRPSSDPRRADPPRGPVGRDPPPGCRGSGAERPRMRRGCDAAVGEPAEALRRLAARPRGFRSPPGSRRPPGRGTPARARPGKLAAVTAHDAPFAGVGAAVRFPRRVERGVGEIGRHGLARGLGRHRTTSLRPAARRSGDGTAADPMEVPGA